MDALARWHQTKTGHAVFGAIELAAAYVFALLAIDRGSWWWYALTIIFFVGGMQNVTKLVGKAIRRGKAGRAR